MSARRRKSWAGRLLRQLMRTEAAHAFLGWLLGRYAKFVFLTSRWTHMGEDEGKRTFLEAGRRVHVLLWHNRVALAPFGWQFRDHRLTVLISDHRDGRITTQLLKTAGVDILRVPASSLGARTEGEHTSFKAATARAIRRVSAEGHTVSVVGDGPTGPRHVLKPFVIDLARLCGAEITLMTYSVKRRIVARSWDRLIIPLPFNRGIYRWSTWSYDPRGLDAGGREALRARIERDLRAFSDETDAMMGHPPLE